MTADASLQTSVNAYNKSTECSGLHCAWKIVFPLTSRVCQLKLRSTCRALRDFVDAASNEYALPCGYSLFPSSLLAARPLLTALTLTPTHLQQCPQLQLRILDQHLTSLTVQSNLRGAAWQRSGQGAVVLLLSRITCLRRLKRLTLSDCLVADTWDHLASLRRLTALDLSGLLEVDNRLLTVLPLLGRLQVLSLPGPEGYSPRYNQCSAHGFVLYLGRLHALTPPPPPSPAPQPPPSSVSAPYLPCAVPAASSYNNLASVVAADTQSAERRADTVRHPPPTAPGVAITCGRADAAAASCGATSISGSSRSGSASSCQKGLRVLELRGLRYSGHGRDALRHSRPCPLAEAGVLEVLVDCLPGLQALHLEEIGGSGGHMIKAPAPTTAPAPTPPGSNELHSPGSSGGANGAGGGGGSRKSGLTGPQPTSCGLPSCNPTPITATTAASITSITGQEPFNRTSTSNTNPGGNGSGSIRGPPPWPPADACPQLSQCLHLQALTRLTALTCLALSAHVQLEYSAGEQHGPTGGSATAPVCDALLERWLRRPTVTSTISDSGRGGVAAHASAPLPSCPLTGSGPTHRQRAASPTPADPHLSQSLPLPPPSSATLASSRHNDHRHQQQHQKQHQQQPSSTAPQLLFPSDLDLQLAGFTRNHPDIDPGSEPLDAHLVPQAPPSPPPVFRTPLGPTWPLLSELSLREIWDLGLAGLAAVCVGLPQLTSLDLSGSGRGLEPVEALWAVAGGLRGLRRLGLARATRAAWCLPDPFGGRLLEDDECAQSTSELYDGSLCVNLARLGTDGGGSGGCPGNAPAGVLLCQHSEHSRPHAPVAQQQQQHQQVQQKRRASMLSMVVDYYQDIDWDAFLDARHSQVHEVIEDVEDPRPPGTVAPHSPPQPTHPLAAPTTFPLAQVTAASPTRRRSSLCLSRPLNRASCAAALGFGDPTDPRVSAGGATCATSVRWLSDVMSPTKAAVVGAGGATPAATRAMNLSSGVLLALDNVAWASNGCIGMSAAPRAHRAIRRLSATHSPRDVMSLLTPGGALQQRMDPLAVSTGPHVLTNARSEPRLAQPFHPSGCHGGAGASEGEATSRPSLDAHINGGTEAVGACHLLHRGPSQGASSHPHPSHPYPYNRRSLLQLPPGYLNTFSHAPLCGLYHRLNRTSGGDGDGSAFELSTSPGCMRHAEGVGSGLIDLGWGCHNCSTQSRHVQETDEDDGEVAAAVGELVSSLTGLEELDLGSWPVTAGVMRQLMATMAEGCTARLQRLGLSGCALNETAAVALRRLTGLRRVDVSHSRPEAFLLHSLASMPGLEEVEVEGCRVYFDSGKALQRLAGVKAVRGLGDVTGLQLTQQLSGERVLL